MSQPSVKPGQHLGRYVIRHKLAAGGMGQIWQATDEQLGRDVAVKVLPAHLVTPAHRQRFDREIKAVAALSHPNILSIFDSGEADGVSFAVMELLEGEPLSTRIARGPLPVREALELGRQVASALAAAHGKGIAHRDIKPDNLFVLPDGRVKVLDFGLASLGHDSPDQEGSTWAGDDLHTRPGTLLGTVGYLSPEQALGRPADPRTDLFSLGCVLYEALCGRRPFTGASAVDTLYATVHREVDPLVGLPVGVDRLVRRCLEKDPARRFQAARDLEFAFETLLGTGPSASIEVLAPPVPLRSSRRQWLAAAALVGTAAASSAATAWLGGAFAGDPTDASSLRWVRLGTLRGSLLSARYDPTGGTVYVSARWGSQPLGLYRAATGGGEMERFDAPPCMVCAVGERDLFVILAPRSRSGRWIGTLARIPRDGGPPFRMEDDVVEASGVNGDLPWAVWGPEDLRFPYPKPAPERWDEGRVGVDGRLATRVGADPGRTLVVVDPVTGRTDVRGAIENRYDEDVRICGVSPDSAIWASVDQRERGGTELRRYSVDGVRVVYREGPDTRVEDVSSAGNILVVRARGRSAVRYQAPEAPAFDWPGTNDAILAGLDRTGQWLLWSSLREELMFVGRPGQPPLGLGKGRALDLAPDGSCALLARDEALVLSPLDGTARALVPLTDWAVGAGWLHPEGGAVVHRSTREADQFARVGPDGRVVPFGPTGAVNWYGSRALSPDGAFVVCTSRAGRPGSMWRLRVGTDEIEPLPTARLGEVLMDWLDARTGVLVTRDTWPCELVLLDVLTGERTPWGTVDLPEDGGAPAVSTFRTTPDGRIRAFGYGRAHDELFEVRGLG